MNGKLRRASALVLVSLFMLGCASGKQPFLIVQTCLSNEQGVAKFFNEMKLIATAEKFDFVNNSSNTKRNLDAIGYAGDERTNGSPVINIAVQRKDGLGVTAGNLSLPGYQVALGFSEGSNATAAHEFASRVVKRLEQHWPMTVVPAGTGAKPMGNCK